MDQTTLKKSGHEGSYVHPPLKNGGPPFFKDGWKGGKGGPPLKGGCSSIKYTLAEIRYQLTEAYIRQSFIQP